MVTLSYLIYNFLSYYALSLFFLSSFQDSTNFILSLFENMMLFIMLLYSKITLECSMPLQYSVSCQFWNEFLVMF